jgi:fermentation-respiration switch protein FrsA (DUF1100 family)
VIWFGLAIVLALIALLALVRMAEAGFAFFPLRGEERTPADLGVTFDAFTAATADGEQLRVWHLPHDEALAQVVYFHGNGGNLSLWADILVDLWRRRLDVVAVDYRGYGASTGRPSERGLYLDVDATLGLVESRLRRRDLETIYWGRSLGAAMAAYAASSRPADGVILESAFPSARSVFETIPPLWALSWLSSYRFPTAQWMQSVRQPALVLHGDADSVIPYRLGKRLYEQIPGPKQMVTIRGGDHNDPAPREAEKYWTAVEGFIASLGIP